MRLTKIFGMAGALVVSAVIGGTLIGSALATTDPDSDPSADADRAEYCEVFLDTLAAELGTTRDGLREAGITAAGAALDAAVANGDLTQEQADAIRERIADADVDGCAWFGHRFARGLAHGFDRGIARGFLGGDVFEAAADALGIESADLIGQLREAGSLEALAEELGVGYDQVKAGVIAAVQADLDAAVAEGLSQERADAVIERLTDWLDDGGELDGFRPGFRVFEPGAVPFNGPWDDHGEGEGLDEDAGASDAAGA